MIFVTENEAVIHDAVGALQRGGELSHSVRVTTPGGIAEASGRVIRVKNLPDGPRGQRRSEIETIGTRHL